MRGRSEQDQPLAASKLELLPAAFGGENRYVHLSSWSRDRDDVRPLVPRLAAPRGSSLDASAAQAAGTLAVVRTDGTNARARRPRVRVVRRPTTGRSAGSAAMMQRRGIPRRGPGRVRRRLRGRVGRQDPALGAQLRGPLPAPGGPRRARARFAAAGAVAAVVGGLLGAALPDRALAIGGGIVFLVFAVLSLREHAE